MRIAILGFAKEGKTSKHFLRTLPYYRGAHIEIRDKKQGALYLRHLEKFDIIFRTPGIPYTCKEIQKARAHGVQISSATKLFFELIKTDEKIKKQKPIIIGITGTKGKGTTATLLYRILGAAHKRVYLGGNIGTPALSLIPELQKQTPKRPYVILELSSFQLHDLTTSPHIAIVLDIFPDHLDHHKNTQEYYGAKASITKYQARNNISFYAAQNKESARIGRMGNGKHIPVATTKFTLFALHDLKLKGEHNFKNAVMAARVAQSLGVSPHIIKKATCSFWGTPHRLEFIRAIQKTRGTHSHDSKNIKISFYNDSASTNPHTTAAAIRAFPDEPIILIAGGQDKNLDYAPLTKALRTSTVEHILLFGENKQKIALAIKASRIPITFATTLKNALEKSLGCVRTLTAKRSTLNLVILFSPGSASFDMFKNYAHRGEQFKKLVRNMRKP